MVHIGVALSGGGRRAMLFGLSSVAYGLDLSSVERARGWVS
jgi:hypothetical protein